MTQSLRRLLFALGLALFCAACGLANAAPAAPAAAPANPAAPAAAPSNRVVPPPVVTLAAPEGLAHGTVTLGVVVHGEAGARLSAATVDGKPIPLGDPLRLDTRSLADGTHRIEVTATNASGGSTRESTQINTDNTAPVVSMVADPPDVAQGKFIIVHATVSEPVTRIEGWIDGEGVYIAQDATGFWALYSYGPDAPLGPRRADFHAIDEAGNETWATVPFRVTRTAYPVEYIDLLPGRETLLDPVLVDAELFKLDQVWRKFTPERRWDGLWIIPAEGPETDVFGSQRSYNGGPVGGHHLGYDIGAFTGVPIYAANNGTVVLNERLIVRGNTVILDHGFGVFTMYNHMSAFAVAMGQTVKKGDLIGYVGDTGLVTGPHLHWEAHVHIEPIDPLELTRHLLP